MTVIRFRADGRAVEVSTDPISSLRSVLVEDLGSHAIVEPCGVGACGACTVLVDGISVLSCLYPAGLADGRDVTTIEGLPVDDPVIEAFVRATAFQCGSCTPGFVLATHDAIRTTPGPVGYRTIVDRLGGNLCRCGSYRAIAEAATAVLTDGGPDA